MERTSSIVVLNLYYEAAYFFPGYSCFSPTEPIITVKISELPSHDELQENILMLSPS